MPLATQPPPKAVRHVLSRLSPDSVAMPKHQAMTATSNFGSIIRLTPDLLRIEPCD